MAEDGRVKIDKFNEKDFGFRKIQIKDYLYQQNVHECFSEDKTFLMKQEDCGLLDWQSHGVVCLSFTKSATYNIVNEKLTYGLIKSLSNMYEKYLAANKVILIRQLVTSEDEGRWLTG